MHEPSVHPDELEGAGPICRICLSGKDASELVSPCACRGTQAYVHLRCLRRWQQTSNSSSPHESPPNPKRGRQCPVCLTNYAPAYVIGPPRSLFELFDTLLAWAPRLLVLVPAVGMLLLLAVCFFADDWPVGDLTVGLVAGLGFESFAEPQLPSGHAVLAVLAWGAIAVALVAALLTPRLWLMEQPGAIFRGLPVHRDRGLHTISARLAYDGGHFFA